MFLYQVQKKKLLTTCLLIVFILYVTKPQTKTSLATLSTQFYFYLYPEKGIYCYHLENKEKGDTLPDIADSDPPKGRSIFFHETSCYSHLNGKIVVTARQACAVESAARLNPNLQIYLLFASPGKLKFDGSESDRFLQALMTYDNVNINYVDLKKYTKDTPVEDLYKTGQIDISRYPQSHASDVLRFLSLWKYGGIYLDLDVVVIKSLEDLPLNFAGSESAKNVAAGVLGFSPSGSGHALARFCLEDLKRDFRGSEWGYNGPGVITRLLQKICAEEEAKDMVGKECGGFTVYPPETFYAVPWWNWTMYFDEEAVDAVTKASKRSYVVHVWNKHSVYSKVPVTARVPYLIFAKEFCPRVLKECDEFF